MDKLESTAKRKPQPSQITQPQSSQIHPFYSSHSKRKIKHKIIEDLEYQTPKISSKKKKRFSTRKSISTTFKTQTSNKGPWTDQEDKKLIELVEKNGPEKWSYISSFFPDRIGKQCRERWFNHLNPTVKKSTWLKEEEWILFIMHQNLGNKWSKLCEYLPGRTDNTIKNHWNSTMQKKLKDYNNEYIKLIKDKNKDEIKQVEMDIIEKCKYVIKDDNEKFYDEKYKNYEKFKNCKIENRQTASKLKKLLLFRTHSKKTKKRGRKRKYIKVNEKESGSANESNNESLEELYIPVEIKKRKIENNTSTENNIMKNPERIFTKSKKNYNFTVKNTIVKPNKKFNVSNAGNNLNVNKATDNTNIKLNTQQININENNLNNDYVINNINNNNLSLSQDYFQNISNSITKNFITSNKKLITPIKDSMNNSRMIKNSDSSSSKIYEKIQFNNKNIYNYSNYINNNNEMEYTNIKGHLIFPSSIKKSVKAQKLINDDNLINNDNFNNINRLFEQNENMTPNKPYFDSLSFSDTFKKNLNNKYIFTSNKKFDEGFGLFGSFGGSPFKGNENINLDNIFSITMKNDYNSPNEN